MIERNTPLSYTVYPKEITLSVEESTIIDEDLAFNLISLETYDDLVSEISIDVGYELSSFNAFTFEADTDLDIDDLINQMTFRLASTPNLRYIYDESQEAFILLEDAEIKLGDVIVDLVLIEVEPEPESSNLWMIAIGIGTISLLSISGYLVIKTLKKPKY